MKKGLLLSATSLALALLTPCFSCSPQYTFPMEEDEIPHSFLKVSIDGFSECQDFESQITLLESDMSSSENYHQEPTNSITPSSSPDDDKYFVFSDLSATCSPRLEGLRPQELENIRTISLSLIDPTYPPQLRLSDLCDFYARKAYPSDPSTRDLQAVRDDWEKVLALNFFRQLQNAERSTPGLDLLNSPNFLCWHIVPTDNEMKEEGYITATLKMLDNQRFADLCVYSHSQTINKDFMNRVTDLLQQLVLSLRRESRSQKLNAIQIDVTEDNKLMQAVVDKLKLTKRGIEVPVGIHYTTSKKRSLRNGSDETFVEKIHEHLYWRYFMTTTAWNKAIHKNTPQNELF